MEKDPDSESVAVEITWLLAVEGGRMALPDGLRYSTVAIFEEDKGEPHWSMVLTFNESPLQQGKRSLGRAHFLMPWAPHERLQSGRTFTLHEGWKKVADVRIL